MRHKQTKSFGAKKSESAAPMRGKATPENGEKMLHTHMHPSPTHTSLQYTCDMQG